MKQCILNVSAENDA